MGRKHSAARNWDATTSWKFARRIFPSNNLPVQQTAARRSYARNYISQLPWFYLTVQISNNYGHFLVSRLCFMIEYVWARPPICHQFGNYTDFLIHSFLFITILRLRLFFKTKILRFNFFQNNDMRINYFLQQYEYWLIWRAPFNTTLRFIPLLCVIRARARNLGTCEFAYS